MGALALDGNVTIRVNSIDPITLQLFSNNEPIVLSAFADIQILLKSDTDGIIKSFTKSGNPTQVIIIPDATIFDDGVEGEALQFIPLSADFPLVDRYKYYIDLIDGIGGSHPVPEDQEYIFDVRSKFSTP
jgi:hypothetical protein